MQEEGEVLPLNGHQIKGSENNLVDIGGLNRFMACQPRTFSQFLCNSSLEAHMLTVFKTSTMNIKTTNNNGHMQL